MTQDTGGNPNDSGKKAIFRAEDPLQIGEDFIKLLQGIKDLDQKRGHARELLKKLQEIVQKNQSAQDLYDVAETFYSTGNLIWEFIFTGSHA